MSNYRKSKWIIEGRLRRWVGGCRCPPGPGVSGRRCWCCGAAVRWGGPGAGCARGGRRMPRLRLGRLKVALAKKTGRPEAEITGLEDGRRRRSSRLTEETGLEMEEEEESRGRKYRREEEVGRPQGPWGAGRGAEGGTHPWGLFPPGRGSLTGAVPSPGGHVCVQRPGAGEADREAGQGERAAAAGGSAAGRRGPSPPSALPAEADVLPQEAAPLLADAAGGFSGPGPVQAPVLGPAPPGRHLRGGHRG